MTDAELTILSLIAEAPQYGHDIQRAIDERGLREWLTVGFSSIYYILNKLEEQKLIKGDAQADNRGMARKLYTLTEAGRGVLQTAIANLLRQPRALGDGFELGLALLHVLKPAQVYRVLSGHRADLEHQLAAVKRSYERHQQDEHGAFHVTALYTHSIALMEAEIVWLRDFLQDWVTRYPAVVDARRTTDEIQLDDNITQLNRRPTPDAVRMIQRLKPIPPDQPDTAEPESDD